MIRRRGVSYVCVSCGAAKTKVKDTRPVLLGKRHGIRRRRHCQQCDARFNTVEVDFDGFEDLNVLNLANAKPMMEALGELERAMSRLASLINGR